MQREGPTLETLTHRLAETPADFLAEPLVGKSGTVNVAAVVHDLLDLLARGASPVAPKPDPTSELAELIPFLGTDAKQDRNRLSTTLILAWMLADPWFAAAGLSRDELLSLLRDDAGALAEQIAAPKFTNDPDRREELARFALARLGLRPAGETEAQAQDRLTTLSTVERSRVLRASRRAEERAAAIRAELARKAAEESADKWTRE